MAVHPINRSRPAGDAPSVRLSRGAVVEYEQHGQPILAVVIEEQRGKWLLHTERDESPALTADRLFLLHGSNVPPGLSREQRTAALRQLSRSASEMAEELDLEEAWTALDSGKRDYSVAEIAKALFPDPAPVQILAVRHSLMRDRIYFRRTKESFERRSAEELAEGREAAAIAAKEEREREELLGAILARLSGAKDHVLPPTIIILEEAAALGSAAQQSKAAYALLETVEERSGVKFEGRAEERCFKLLERIGHFDRDFDLNLIRADRRASFPESVESEALRLCEGFVANLDRAARPVVRGNSVTIDGEDTRDADDALSLEKTENGFILGIHISDVAAVISVGTACDLEARRRATSVYAPDYTLTMFPRSLAEGTLSLVEGERRAVMSFYAELTPSGDAIRRWIERSEITVTKRLSYDGVDKLLEEEPRDEISRMVHELWRLSGLLEASRLARGAIQFNRRELFPSIKDGKIVLIESGEDLPARKLISELMIFANETAALYGKENRVPLLYRGQEAPDGDIPTAGERIAEGPAREYFMRGLMKRSEVAFSPRTHAGLGVQAYIQGTSPIRRYGDLLNQRQIGAALAGRRADDTPLREVFDELESRLDEANYLQRMRSRYFIQRYLQQEGYTEVEGIIVKAEVGRTLVELAPTLTIHPFYPRDGSDGVGRVGERIKLRVEKNNPRREQLVLREMSV